MLLVRTEVEGADGDGQTVHVLHHLAVGFELFVLGRQVAAIQVQELGAEQSDAVGTVLHGAGNVVRQLDVGVQFDRRAVQRRGPGFSQPPEFQAFEFPLFLAQFVLAQNRSCRD